jgi:two-component system response regulator HydG
MSRIKILIIEDNPLLCRQLANWLGKRNVVVEYTFYISKAKKIIASGDIDLIMSDIRLPDGDGIEFLEWMCCSGYRIPFIVMTDYAEISSAVHAMKLGAVDYFPKPLDLGDLSAVIDNLLKNKTQHRKQSGLFKRDSFQIREVERQARLVAKTDMSVLVRGSNGTGKEYVARLIHQLSSRSAFPFVPVDCGAIPKELSPSEFFGYVKGAFTGAIDNRTGVFHEAEGGTLFLDEIGNLPYEVQSSLLRVLQEKRYRQIGGKNDIVTNVRILAATNENIEVAISEGRFREDLYHRICEFEIIMPALAECREDVLPLAVFFLKQSNMELGKNASGFDTEASKAMLSYTWPGNVRELKNRVKRAVLLTESGTVGIAALNLDQIMERTSDNGYSLKLKGEEERERILKALATAKGNKTLAAELLKTTRTTLYKLLEKYGIR